MAKKNKNAKNNASLPTTISENSSFNVVESYKAIRTNLSFALHKQKGCKKIMFTSGMTITSINTAITIAQAGLKTLILDCDLRKPQVHKRFGINNEIGLSNLLSGMETLENAIHPTGRDNLWAITAGVLPPNPAELLGSETMEELMKALNEKFDYIVIDTPPINVVSDALSLTKLIDGVVLVVRYKASTHPELRDSMAKLQFIGANVIGMIMNGAPSIVRVKPSG